MKIKRIIVCVLVIGVLLTLTGCSKNVSNKEYSDNNEFYGEILDKYYIPRQEIHEHKTVNGEYIDIMKVINEAWIIKIQRPVDDDFFITEIEITQEEWDNLKIGDWYPNK